MTGIIVSAPSYYLNSLEKVYIERFQTHSRVNPYGWNRSWGGEGVAPFTGSFVLQKNGTYHYGTGVYEFLKQNPTLDLRAFVNLLERKINEWDGWNLPLVG